MLFFKFLSCRLLGLKPLGNGFVEAILSKIAPTWNDYYVGRGTTDEL